MPANRRKIVLLKIVAKNIRNWIEKQSGDNRSLEGYCYDGSVTLQAAIWALPNLRARKIRGVVTKDAKGYPINRYHWWVESCGYVIDVTATQFGYRNKVKMFKLNKKVANGYHND